MVTTYKKSLSKTKRITEKQEDKYKNICTIEGVQILLHQHLVHCYL